jgi:hypothetical protein
MSSTQQVLLMTGKVIVSLSFITPSGPITVNEGSIVTFVVAAPNAPPNTVYWWAAFGVNGSTSEDASAPSPPLGSFAIVNGTGTFTLTIATDLSTPEANEGFFVRLYSTQTEMLQLGSGLLQSPTVTITDIPPPPGPVFNDFDYMVVRFKWTSADGLDLDTRTSIINSGTNYDGIQVGYCKNGTSSGSAGSIVGPSGSTPGFGPYFLYWAGDGASTANVEAHLIDFKQMDISFSNPNIIKVELRAFWWAAKYSGLVTLELATYSGGTMIMQNFDFINQGGSLVTTTSVQVTVDLQQMGCHNGLCMKHLIYTTASRDAVLIDCSGTGTTDASTINWTNPDIISAGV